MATGAAFTGELAGCPQLDEEHNQALLNSVVQISLQPAAPAVVGRDNPSTGSSEPLRRSRWVLRPLIRECGSRREATCGFGDDERLVFARSVALVR